ncbi:hypothetical protein L5515_010279 [Caenorhabditis briggsae]|uniref:DUF19 domain-containing protein n=1 Tax=Caenorhabditis briggsae TaxID=6238 RepID=A0AAE9ELP7_CAEBR|nr:hypothetical protein L5515_010279 [Caenorhabditis briggsae]
MRAICLLILLISLVESSPTVSGCKRTSFIDSCFGLIPANMWRVVPKEEFEAKKPKIQEYINCIGNSTCEGIRSLLKTKKTRIDIMERASEIHGCLGNRTFDNHKAECSSGETMKGCSEYSNCLVQKVDKEEKCSHTDVEKFKQIAMAMTELCKMKLD